MRISQTKTDRGTVFTLSADGRSTAVHLGNHAALDGLTESNRALSEHMDRAYKTFQPDVAIAELRKVAKPTLASVRKAIEAGRKERRAITEAEAVLRAVPVSVDMSLASERRARFAKMDRVAQMQAVQAADLPDLAALVADGNLADIAPEAFTMAEQRYIALAHIARTGMLAGFERQPTLAMLTATGPDMAEAERAANDALDQHQARKDAMQNVEATLQHQIALLAVALNMTPQNVLTEVLKVEAA